MKETKATETFSDQMNTERRERVISFVDAFRTKMLDESAEWGRETVKHLFILNGAGLAASATVLAANVAEDARTWVSVSGGTYAAGLVCAFFMMVWRWFVYSNMASQLAKFSHDFALSLVPFEKIEALRERWTTHAVSYSLGLVSFAAFFFASYILFHVLRSTNESSISVDRSAIAYRFQLPPQYLRDIDSEALRLRDTQGMSY